MPKTRVSKQALAYMKGIKRELAASIGAQAGIRAARMSYAKFKSVPTRFRYSKRRYRKNVGIVNQTAKFSERKLSPWINLNEAAPSAIQTGAQAYYYAFTGGSVSPPAWTGFNALAGFAYKEGTASNERVGKYMFLDHTTLNMSVHMNQSSQNQPPTQFRVIVFKARRAMTPAGFTNDPGKTMFLNPAGGEIGHLVNNVNGNDLMLLPTNKRKFIIVQDRKFTLQAPMAQSTGETASFQGKYPTYKQMRIMLNHKAKTAFQNTSNEPQDYDFYYGVLIYASNVARDIRADQWEVNLRGTTSAFDN